MINFPKIPRQPLGLLRIVTNFLANTNRRPPLRYAKEWTKNQR
ncbi:MAG: hypothetical protein VKK42_14370 [Lyngbya sp.]|nr:hypothetical protein [Lyngbya sp.]